MSLVFCCCWIFFNILMLSCLSLGTRWAPWAQDPGLRSDGRCTLSLNASLVMLAYAAVHGSHVTCKWFACGLRTFSICFCSTWIEYDRLRLEYGQHNIIAAGAVDRDFRLYSSPLNSLWGAMQLLRDALGRHWAPFESDVFSSLGPKLLKFDLNLII
jgi:hypothetical protein